MVDTWSRDGVVLTPTTHPPLPSSLTQHTTTMFNHVLQALTLGRMGPSRGKCVCDQCSWNESKGLAITLFPYTYIVQYSLIIQMFYAIIPTADFNLINWTKLTGQISVAAIKHRPMETNVLCILMPSISLDALL